MPQELTTEESMASLAFSNKLQEQLLPQDQMLMESNPVQEGMAEAPQEAGEEDMAEEPTEPRMDAKIRQVVRDELQLFKEDLLGSLNDDEPKAETEETS